MFVFARWEEPGEPDGEGEQLKAIQAHLCAHSDIKFVWYDFWCIPQRTAAKERTSKEQREFELMLSSIADLYLTAYVLIVMDNTYITRFWCMMEGWCAMMTATADGVRTATIGERRYTVVCIHNAADTAQAVQEQLVGLLATKSPTEMWTILAKPDVLVTNAGDKNKMLPVVMKANEHVRAIMRITA